MQMYRLEDSIGGWFIGNFENAAYKTKSAEVSYKIHKSGEKWDWHYHEHLDEINLLINGTMMIQGKLIVSGDIFILEPNELADPTFIDDCEIICVKLPNFTNDKIIVKRELS